jgi:hypothetical protein
LSGFSCLETLAGADPVLKKIFPLALWELGLASCVKIHPAWKLAEIASPLQHIQWAMLQSNSLIASAAITTSSSLINS